MRVALLAVVLLASRAVAQPVVIQVGSVQGVVGESVELPVTLSTGGAAVAGVLLDVGFAPDLAEIPHRANGRPDCAVNPDIEKNGTSFTFQPTGCTPGNTCTSVRAFVVANDNVDPIPDGAILFTCRTDVHTAAGSPFVMQCREPRASDPDGGSLNVSCESGSVYIGASPTPANTRTATATATPTPTRTTTRTATNTRAPTATAIDTVTRTAAPTAPTEEGGCCGDCAGDGQVTINDLIVAVNNALNSCPVPPTPTHTRVPPPTRTPPPFVCPYQFNDEVTVDDTCGYIADAEAPCDGVFENIAVWFTSGSTVIVSTNDAAGNYVEVYAQRTSPTTARVLAVAADPDFERVDATGSIAIPSNTRLTISYNAGTNCNRLSFDGTFDGFYTVTRLAAAALEQPGVTPTPLRDFTRRKH